MNTHVNIQSISILALVNENFNINILRIERSYLFDKERKIFFIIINNIALFLPFLFLFFFFLLLFLIFVHPRIPFISFHCSHFIRLSYSLVCCCSKTSAPMNAIVVCIRFESSGMSTIPSKNC